MNMTQQKNDAREALSKFLEAWKLRDYSTMAKHVTHTWRKTKDDNGAKDLEAMFPFKFKNYRISQIQMKVPTVASFKVKVNDRGNEHTLFFNLVCEVAAFVPSAAGEWGVNPKSIVRL